MAEALGIMTEQTAAVKAPRGGVGGHREGNGVEAGGSRDEGKPAAGPTGRGGPNMNIPSQMQNQPQPSQGGSLLQGLQPNLSAQALAQSIANMSNAQR
jgi:hypothetical protein